MGVRGIDCSSYQSETPDLDGMDFCFIKATEGDYYVNPKMRAQAAHARKHGLVVGFYAFLRPGDMKAQARYFVDKAASLEGDPLIADWEVPGVSQAARDAFVAEVKRLRGDTHRVGLYCNTNYWLTRDTNHGGPADFLWIATYNGHPGHPGIKDRWLFHQYTDRPVDTSVGQFKDRAALRAWCTKKPGKTPTHTSTEDDMQLDDLVQLNAWIPKTWPKDAGLKDGEIAVETALGSTYGHARAGRAASEAGLAQLGALRGTLDKLIEKAGAGGLTKAEVQDAAEQGARLALADLGKRLTEETRS